ncbi:MAG: hypothetical protein M3R35_00550 [Candidatus Eremiobacteraeota bacterium]|nr:hypothetical protein [Candidatus Eremiobacteraeota bacterium]
MTGVFYQMRASRFVSAAASLAAASLFVAALSACGGGGATGTSPIPNSPTGNTPNSVPARSINPQGESITDGDRAAAGSATNLKTHIMLPATSKTKTAQAIIYPADLMYRGGPVLPTAKILNIYVNAKPSDFGSPSTFEHNLGASNMIHITDQYVNSRANSRYGPDSPSDLVALYPTYTTLADNDLLAILHHFAAFFGGGYGTIYNVFLPKGTDFCETGTTACNASQTSPSPTFCAFHGSITYGDVGHVLFTLQPYQDPSYCGVNAITGVATTPNGVLNDSTYSTLSHELFETITDPDPPSGWYTGNVGVSGEIGDLCAYLSAPVSLNGHAYYIQTEYANSRHACSNESR